jgi:hypothetical protein
LQLQQQLCRATKLGKLFRGLKNRGKDVGHQSTLTVGTPIVAYELKGAQGLLVKRIFSPSFPPFFSCFHINSVPGEETI